MPTNPVPSKKNAILQYGAKVVDGGSTSITMYEKAMELHEKEGLVIIHPFEDPLVIAGQGTIGLEILEELPDVDTVVIPVSGGGLISGVAAALKETKPSVRVIGVNTEGAKAMYESLRKGYPFEVEKVETIADGLMAKKPGELTFAHTQKYVDEMVLVSEEEIIKTVLSLLERAKLVVEPSGAAALAAMIHGRTAIQGKKVAALVSGGNVNIKLLSELIDNYL